jgi:hypothetical protein
MVCDRTRYRKLAATCDRMAKVAADPTQWLGFAAEYERMSKLCDWLELDELASDAAALAANISPGALPDPA